MSWRDDLRPAQFRGVVFEAIRVGRTPGRVVAIHEFPQRDQIAAEDVRAATRSFSVEAYIIGPDYMARRDVFEAALDRPGPGVLILPWTGQVTARLTSANATESSAEGGMVRYQLEFVEETPRPPLVVVANTGAQSKVAADAVAAQAQADFTQGFSVANWPQFIADGAAGVVTQIAGRFDAVTAGLKGAGQTLSGYVAQAQALREDVLDLVHAPADLASRVSGLMRDIREVAATPKDALNALKTLLRFGDDLKPVAGSTPARRAQAENQAQLVTLTRHLAVAAIVKAAADAEFRAYPDAVAVRDELADLLDAISLQAGDAGQDDGYRVLVTARAALINDITARGGTLAPLRQHTPPVTLPALLLAHQLYPGADPEAMSQDIVTRNQLSRPGFVPNGVALEVLANAG